MSETQKQAEVEAKPATAAKPEHDAQRVTTTGDRKAETEEEWGKYVALVPIDIQGVRAFNAGDPVPIEHVKRGLVDPSEVGTRTSKVVLAVVATAGGLDVADDTKGK